MSIKKLFNKDDELKTILTSTDIEAVGKETESAAYIKSFTRDKDRFVPHVDFSSASNFAKFGSAEQYYEDAIKRVYKTYPYDGSLKEKLDWHNSSSYFENYIFDNRYPRTTGYIIFAADGWGTKGSASDRYSSSSLGEYILFKGGPHPSKRSKGKEITDGTGDYKSGYSNYFNISHNRESNLKIDGGDGNSVEFWMKKDAFDSTNKTEREVIFDTYTANAAYTAAGYGRMRIELTGHDTDQSTLSPFLLTYMSGNVGFASASIGSNVTTTTVADEKWHHYAFTVVNSGSNLQAKLYVDGQCNHTIVGGGGETPTDAVLTFVTGDRPDAGDTLTITSADGTTVTYTWVVQANESAADAKVHASNTTTTQVDSLQNAIEHENNHGGNISCTQSGGGLILTLADNGENTAGAISKTGATDGQLAITTDFAGGSVTNLAKGASTATIDYVSGAMVATIGALATSPSGTSTPDLGWGKLSGSLDEFRFWKTKRNPQEIGRYWIGQIGGGANTDKANTHLGVYYKFNEGIVGSTTPDKTVLDYSGRISNGSWFGYTSVSRNTGSAIVSASITNISSEFEDPILYSGHSKVNGLLTSSILIGREYDYRNNASLYHSFPDWIVDEDTDKTLKKLTQIIATYLDTLYLQIQELPRIKNVNYLSGAHKPYPFTNKILESKGFIAPDLFPDVEIIEHFLNRSEKEFFAEKLYDVKNKIYQNIYNNLSYIYKSKGTEKAFRNLIRCYGVGHELLKLNLYGDKVVYNFEDNFSSISVKKKAIDFNHPDRYDATVYQFTGSQHQSNTSSFSFISGSAAQATASVPMTVEAEVIFPKKFHPKNAYYKHTPFLSSSLFGMHTAETLADSPPDLTWYDTDPANFQVYAIRKTDSHNIINGKGYTRADAYFMLTSSAAVGSVIPELTSSVFSNVYDNSKWNFAVRIRPTNYPFAGHVPYSLDSNVTGSHTTYNVEFYGVNSHADVVTNEFLVTGTIPMDRGIQFMTSSKRLYLGAHRTNFTGSALKSSDVKITSARYWQSYLDDRVIKAHAKDPENFGTLHPYRSAYLFEDLSLPVEIPQINTLALNWDFETLSGSSAGRADDYYGGSAYNANFIVDDTSSGSVNASTFESWTGSYGWLGNIIKRQHTGRGDFFLPNATGSISREYIHSARQNLPENLYSSDTIKVLSRDDEVFTRDTRPTTHFFAIEKSMHQVISQEMLNLFATIVDFNNLVGAPVNRYRQDYKDLAKLRQLFFEKVQNIPDTEKFFDYYKWIDSALSKMILQLMPASARHADKIRNVIESHILERNKYWTKFPTLDNLYPENIQAAAGEKGGGDSPITEPSATGNDSPSNPAVLDYSLNDNIIPSVMDSTNIGSLGTHGPGAFFKKTSQERNKASDSNTGDIRSGDDNVDNDREAIRKVIKEMEDRGGRRPFNFFVDRKRSIDLHVGHNVHKNKRNLALKPIIDFSSKESDVTILSSSIEAESNFARDLRDKARLDRKVKLPFKVTVPVMSDSYGDYIIPFNLYATSVSSGYVSVISSGFSSDVDITNLHNDSVSPTNEIPLQGPFTEKFVGGNQHRHHWSHLKLDTLTTRPEAWKISLSSNTITFSKPDSAAKPRAQYIRDEFAKRSVNIRNIRQTTGSTDDGLYTNIGNYTNDYDIVQSSGRAINNRNFVKNEGINVDWLATQKPDSTALPFYGIPEYTTINRAVTGSNKFVFVERFSAPGDPATMCVGMLDIESGEKSVYNALPWRNLSVRLPLKELLTNHTKQFGFYSDAQYSGSWREAAAAGIKSVGSYPGFDGSVSALNYQGSASFHKTHRNTKRVLKYSNEHTMARGVVLTASVHDNWFIQHPIPQSDMQYQWITASAVNSIIGYQQKDHANASQASTDIIFLSASEYGSYLRESAGLRYFGTTENHLDATAGLSGFTFTDFAGLNFNVVDPITASTNTIGHASGIGADFYSNTGLITSVNPETDARPGTHVMLNAILLHRNGPYQYPSWKQIRTGENQIVRDQRNNNMLSIIEGTGKKGSSFLHLTESAVTSRYLPMKHVLTPKGAPQPVLFKHTYANNLGTFANKKFVEKLNTYILGGDQTYDELRKLYLNNSMPSFTPEFVSFSYQEVIWPREVNMYLDKVRSRKKFINNFWKDVRTDRTQTDVVNSVGETITSQSMWPLDPRVNFEDSLAPTVGETAAAGALLNNHTIFHSASSNPQNSIAAGPLYAYTNWDAHEKPALEIVYSSDTLWEAGSQSGKNPFYNTYKDYNDEIKRVGKDYSIIPEFNLSIDHLEYYLDEKEGNFFVDRDGLLSLTGSEFSASNENKFFTTYAHADFLKHFKVVRDHHKDFAEPAEIKLTCKALMKFLPYDGFYPAQRTIQLAELFSQSYAHDVFLLTSDLHGNSINQSNIRTFYQPLFSPGILYNTIKSGIAVDWPVHTNLNPTASFTGSTANNTEDDCGAGSMVLRFPRIGSDFNKRISFEALVNPKDYLAGAQLADSNPHPSSSLGSMVRWGGSENSSKYRLAMHNFLAESADFFLDNGEFTTFQSAQDTDQGYFLFNEEKPYMMDVVIYRTHDHSKYNLSTAYDVVHMIAGDDIPSKLEMYSNPGAFGPLVDQSFVFTGGTSGTTMVTGAARNPYTPPYYYGSARARLSFTPFNGPGRYTVSEIVTHLTATYARVMGTAGTDQYSTLAKNASWSAPDATSVFSVNLYQSPQFHDYNQAISTARTSSVDYRNAMQISASLNLFQIVNEPDFQIDTETGKSITNIGGFDKGTRWVIQPKFETIVLNFSSSARTLPTPDSGSTAKGMWHQYGHVPCKQDGIFIEIMEPTNHHLYGDPYTQTDVSNVRREKAADTTKTGSLAQKCGFIRQGNSSELKKIGVPRKDNEVSLKEAIVLIPFTRTINKKTSAVTTKFFNLNKNTVKKALKAVKRDIPQSESGVSKSIYDTISAMAEYVIPPKFDFITQMAREQKSKSNIGVTSTPPSKSKVTPFAMYFFEFEHKLSRRDITDIWQNLPPEIGIAFKESETIICHKLLKSELMKEIPGTELHWIVFKVKKKAKQNYFEKTADTLDDALFKFDVGGEKDVIPEYSYNWPYDYCSLVELAKIDAEIKFKKAGKEIVTKTVTTQTVATPEAGKKGLLEGGGEEEGKTVTTATTMQSIAVPVEGKLELMDDEEKDTGEESKSQSAQTTTKKPKIKLSLLD